MGKKKFVRIGHCIRGDGSEKLYCRGIGSCIVIGVYAEGIRTGWLAHVLLPHGDSSERPFLYANLTLAQIVSEIKANPAVTDVWAKLAGGANLFSTGQTGGSIGFRNIEAAVYWLRYHAIPIAAQDTGGTEGRNVEFDLESGQMHIDTLKRGIIII